MSTSEEIIKTALLGTDKYEASLITPLQALGERIAQSEPDREATFLKQAISTLLYEEAGQQARELKQQISICPPEQKMIIPEENQQLLKAILQQKDQVLLDYVIHYCLKHQLVVSKGLVPQLLRFASENKARQADILSICGETGKWLCQLNPAWKKLLTQDESKADWETGTFGQMKVPFRSHSLIRRCLASRECHSSLRVFTIATRQSVISR